MPLIDYKPELLTHPNSPVQRVAAFSAGDLFVPVAGPQVVDRTIWNSTRKSEEFRDRIEDLIDRGVFTILDDTEHPTLSGDSPTKAISLVKECYDLTLLNQWHEDEARPSVLKALKAQIEKLTPPPAKKE